MSFIPLSISVVIPVRDSTGLLTQCLEGLEQSTLQPRECLVVDDGSVEDVTAVTRGFPVRLLRTPGFSAKGPAAARNAGAGAASGDIVLFLDADVRVHPGTLELVRQIFQEQPDLTAVMGAYDDRPAHPGFCSQYRNLMHCFVHRNSRQRAFTFWTGCGAIRREAFLAHHGFDERHTIPSIEDIEFGYRLSHAGCRILLDPAIQVTHLKHWRWWPMLKTDVLGRGIPWTRLILRYKNMPDDLNLRWTQRASVVAVWGALLAGVIGLRHPACFAAAFAMLGGAALLNLPFYRFLREKRGAAFAARAIPLHLCYHFLNGISFLAGTFLHVFGAGKPSSRRAACEA